MKTGKDNHSVKLSTKDVINLKEMDYKEKYEQALERAREQYNKRTPLYDIESIFSELKEKESEDERMKKAIMHVLYENYSDAAVIEGVEIAKIAAWLEKQGEKKPTENAKTLNSDNVIEWLNENVADFWANPCNPNRVINQFKKDFGL